MSDDLTFESDPPPDEDGDRDPIPLHLAVWRRKDGKDPVKEVHDFQCRPRSEVSGHHLTSVSLAADRGAVAAAAEQWRFFEAVMLPDDVRRLDALLADQQVYVDPKVLIQVSQGVFAAYAGRPTRPQQHSEGGRGTRGRTSTAKHA